MIVYDNIDDGTMYDFQHLLHPGLDKRLQVRHQIGVYCNTSFNNVRFSTRLSLTES